MEVVVKLDKGLSEGHSLKKCITILPPKKRS